MSDPAWFQLAYEDAANFSFPTFQECTHVGSNPAQIVVGSALPAAATYFELHLTSAPTSQYCLGVIAENYSGPNVRTNYNSGSAADCAWVAENGAVFSNAVYAGYSLADLSTGSVLAVYVNAANTGLAFSEDGVTWNGSYTITQIIAGVGLLALGSWGSLVPFVSIVGAPGSVSVFASAAHCSFALPAGAAYLPANAVLTASAVYADIGDSPSITWGFENTSGSLTGSLTASIDGGAYTACTGTITGSSGVATVGSPLSEGLHTVSLQDSGDSFNTSAETQFSSVIKPSGAGSLVAFVAGAYTSSVGTLTLTLEGSPYNKIYMYVCWGPGTGLTGTGGVTLQSNTGTEVSTGLNSGSSGTYTISPLPVSSASPTSGPSSYVVTGSFASMTGTLDASITEAGSAYGTSTFSDGTTTTQWGSIESPLAWDTPSGDTFGTLVVNPEGLFGTMAVAVAVWAGPPPELLVLDTVGQPSAGTIALTGTIENATLTALDVSSDSGTTYTPATSLSVSGTAWAATLDDMLSAGTYPMQVRDHTTDVESNIVDLTISGESITLTSLTGTISTPLSFGGESNDGPPASVDVSINGTWGASTTFTSASGTVNAALSGTAGSITGLGTWAVQIRDHNYPYVESNILDLIITALETITIVTGQVGQDGTLYLAGVSSGGPPRNLLISIDNDESFQPAAQYSTQQGDSPLPWTATGPILQGGTYIIRVQDSVTGVLSNSIEITYANPNATIATPGQQYYRMLDENGDYTLGYGAGNWWGFQTQGVAQSVLTRLWLNTGDWFLNLQAGTPWNQEVLGKSNPVTRDMVIKARILDTPYVTVLADYATNVNLQRGYTVTATVTTQFSDITQDVTAVI
jgi:hypothetical protein